MAFESCHAFTPLVVRKGCEITDHIENHSAAMVQQQHAWLGTTRVDHPARASSNPAQMVRD